MTITLTTNYQEVLSTETVEKIDQLLEDNYELTDILKFIDEHNENDFVAHYEQYVDAGENIGYDVVDAFINYHDDVSYVEYVEEAYQGSYHSPADFAEEFSQEIYGDVPSFVVVDWAATWDRNLSYDFDFIDGFVFSSKF